MRDLVDRPYEELLAVKIRHDHDLGRLRVDPFAIAAALDLEVTRFPVEDNGVEGQYRPMPHGAGAIFVNSNANMLRQRFTAAHEIGHALLHSKQVVIDDDIETRSSRVHERQADRFAGALLIDPGSAAEFFERQSGNFDAAVAEVVDVFDVSVPTAAIALEQFGLATRETSDAFLKRYENIAHFEFMQSHGRSSKHRRGSGQLAVDPGYRRRVIAALKLAQVTPARAAALLGASEADLPKAALASRDKVLAAQFQEPEFE